MLGSCRWNQEQDMSMAVESDVEIDGERGALYIMVTR